MKKLTLKNNLSIFVGIFLVGILFVPTAEAASEIPAWIKNNAGWWADGQIDDASFLNGIEYLIDNLILEIQSNQKSNENGMIQLEKPVYEVPPGSQIIKVNVFAKFSNLPYYDMSQRLAFATIQVTRPDGEIDSEDLRASHGVLNYTYMIKSNSPVGEYEISIRGTNDNDIFLELISFKLRAESAEEKAVPAWVKNNAGWWASDTISDAEFVAALQFLVKEGIITTQHESGSFGSAVEILYKTKMTSKKDPFSVFLIQATSNDTCSLEEKRKAIEYGKMSEYLINKNTRPNPTQVTVYCMNLDEITETTYRSVIEETRTILPNMLIFVGNLEANRKIIDDEDSVAWWACNTAFVCKPNQIIICDDCNRWGVNTEDFEDTVDKGMWRISAMIGSANFYESYGDRWDYEAYNWASNSSVNDNQAVFDLCFEFDILENELCSKLYEKVTFLGKPYYVMDINYAKNNWRDDQKDVKKQIISLVGTGSDVEGFSKFTLRETGGNEFESALASPTREVDATDVLTIEYPNDWYEGYYKYDWSIWNEQESLRDYQEDRDLPKDDESLECCHVFQADKATMRVGADLGKDDTRTPERPVNEFGFLNQQMDVFLASVSVWFLENVHYGGATDEERFDALVDSEWKYCSNASFGVDQYECRNFKVLEKTIYATDEGRKAYSLLTSYDLKFVQSGVGQYISTTTEVYIGKDAWQVWTDFDQDLYERSRDKIDRFNSSLVLLDTTYPIPSEPVISKKIVTEDGIQYKANRAWEDSPVWEDTNFSDIEKDTKISKYKVICDTDCNITLNENMEVGEAVTKIWEGTELELAQWYSHSWWHEEVDCTDAKKRLTQIYEEETGQILNVSLCEWDKENQEWVIPKVDKWLYETVDLNKFQDDVLHEQIWDIYKSITPKQIIEEIDTFLISSDDRGGAAAHIINCIDEDDWGCGPPDVPNSKFVINFDPLDFAPTSGERQAMYQPGKLKDALEINMLKSVLIHENAHILSLSASQSDNDLLGWEQFPYDEEWEKADHVKAEQIFKQKASACAPNIYDSNSGCMKDNSYLNLFFQKFWADIYAEYYYWFEFADDRKQLSELVSAFKRNYDNRFVTHYSMTHPAEDFADSFRVFVLWDEEMISNHKKLCSEKKGQWGAASGWNLIQDEGWAYWTWCHKMYPYNAIWEEKIRFFYDFPELVEMRDFIRSNL